MAFLVSIVIGLILFFLVKNSRIDLTSKRMLMMFMVYWLVSIILASLRIFNIFEVDFYTFVIVILGVISFCVGYLFVGKKRNPRMAFRKEDFSEQFERLSNNLFYRIIMIGASAYVYSLLVIFFDKIIIYGSLYNVRMDFYSDELYGPYFQQINAFLLRPLWFISLPLFSYQILYKRNWFCFVLAFFLIGYESLGGGRIGYIRILVGVVFISYCLLQTFKNNKRKGYRIVVLTGSALFILLSIVTTARTIGVDASKESTKDGLGKTVEHIVSYTACPIAAFNYSLDHNYLSIVNGYQYGYLTSSPVIALVNLFSSRIGVTFPTAPTALLEQKQDGLIDISPEMDWNALYTANLYFYLDFGVLGVVLFPFIFGVIISALISQLYRYKSISLVMVVSYCLWCMMYSVLDYALGSPYDLLVLIVLYFWGTRRK